MVPIVAFLKYRYSDILKIYYLGHRWSIMVPNDKKGMIKDDFCSYKQLQIKGLNCMHTMLACFIPHKILITYIIYQDEGTYIPYIN